MNTNEDRKITPENYDPTYRGRYHCMNCGYITVHQLDFETKFLDLHCKCGGAVVRVPPEEDCGAYDIFDVVIGDES